MTLGYIYIGSDNLIQFLGAYDHAGVDYLDGTASGVFSLYVADGDDNGAVVSGASAVAMSFVALSNGDFQGTLTDAVTATFSVGDQFYLEVTITDAGGTPVGLRRQKMEAAYRDFTP